MVVGGTYGRIRALENSRFQELVCRSQSARRPEQIRKYSDFGFQNPGIDRLAQEIDCPDAIRLQDLVLVQCVGRKEKYRDVLTAFALLDQLCQFQSVHAGHFDVENDGCEIVLQCGKQSLIGTLCPDKRIPTRLQNAFKGVEIAALVID